MRNKAGTESGRKLCRQFGPRLKALKKKRQNKQRDCQKSKSDRQGQTNQDSSTCTCCTCSTRNQLWVALFSQTFFRDRNTCSQGQTGRCPNSIVFFSWVKSIYISIFLSFWGSGFNTIIRRHRLVSLYDSFTFGIRDSSPHDYFFTSSAAWQRCPSLRTCSHVQFSLFIFAVWKKK